MTQDRPGDMNKETQEFLVVSALPPLETGIADFSHILYKKADDFTLDGIERQDKDSAAELIRRLIPSLRKYKAAIFVTGNSNHNIEIIKLILAIRGFTGGQPKIYLQIHDPVMNNAVIEALSKTPEGALAFTRFYEKTMQTNIPRSYLQKDNRWKLFADYGITGISYLCRQVSIHGLIYHSKVAADMHSACISRVIPGYETPDKLILFHPCFDKPAILAEEKKEYDFGIFGVMDNGGKSTDKAVRIIKEAFNQGPYKNAVLAGYNAKEWAKENQALIDKRFRIVNSPSREQLFEIMKKTKFCLHLRASCTGESSGVIPMLQAAGCISLVSDIGSFQEETMGNIYKIDNSSYIESGITQIERARRIKERDYNGTIDRFSEFCQTRSPAKFISNLRNSLIASSGVSHFRLKTGLVLSARISEKI